MGLPRVWVFVHVQRSTFGKLSEGKDVTVFPLRKYYVGVLCGEWIVETQNGGTESSLEVTGTVKAGEQSGLDSSGGRE